MTSVIAGVLAVFLGTFGDYSVAHTPRFRSSKTVD